MATIPRDVMLTSGYHLGKQFQKKQECTFGSHDNDRAFDAAFVLAAPVKRGRERWT